MANLVPVDQIKVQNRIRKDYGDIDELAASIKELGLIQPIIVTSDYILIAGERRLMAVKKLGWKEIKAETTTAADREHQLLMEIAENEKRKEFTPSERVAYGLELEQIERLKAKERQAEHGNTAPGRKNTQELSTLSVSGKTDDIVGSKVGMSGQSYRRAKRVVESGDKELIDKMDSKEIGISTAYDKLKAKEKPASKPAVPTKEQQPLPEGKSKFDVDFSFLTKESEETEEDKEFNEALDKMASEAGLMAEFKDAICVPVVSEFILKSIKQKLSEYPDTAENAGNPDRKAFVNAFNILKKIIRKEG